jgi:hypothetical protein
LNETTLNFKPKPERYKNFFAALAEIVDLARKKYFFSIVSNQTSNKKVRRFYNFKNQCDKCSTNELLYNIHVNKVLIKKFYQ